MRSVQDQTGGFRLTTFDQKRTNTAEMPIHTVTTHAQSDPPIVSLLVAVVGLTMMGLTMIVMRSGWGGADRAYGTAVPFIYAAEA